MALTYEKAGVPHLKGDSGYNKKISNLIKSTHIPGVIGNTTGFASLFDLKKYGFRDPILVSCTDGVGTKLEIARLQKKHDSVGIDLVAMCVNDLITFGAKPLFFLDYFATGKFDEKVTMQTLKGIVRGCKESGAALTGGETAIMPGFYQVSKNAEPEYDLAGFTVGVVERSKMVTGEKIKKGDAIIGIESSGFHSNGYSLLRKIFTKDELKGSVGKELLKPTKIYVKPILKLMKAVKLQGICNITGGGLVDNLPRVLPKKLGAIINVDSWRRSPLFSRVQESGKISDYEMFRTFNMGIGMTVIVKLKDAEKVQKKLAEMKLKSWHIGDVIEQPGVYLYKVEK